MSRSRRKNTVACKKIGERFAYVIEQELGWTLSKAAAELGYANPTTLYAIKQGKALPDPERLVVATQKLTGHRGQSINLHWVLTGVGPTFMEARKGRLIADIDTDIINIISHLTEAQKKALGVLLGQK